MYQILDLSVRKYGIHLLFLLPGKMVLSYNVWEYPFSGQQQEQMYTIFSERGSTKLINSFWNFKA
jgi:hypothetical protein